MLGAQDIIKRARGWLDEYEKDAEIADDWVQGFEAAEIIQGLLFHLNGALGLISLMSTPATSPTQA